MLADTGGQPAPRARAMHSCPHSSVNGTGVDDTQAGLRLTATHKCPAGAKLRGSQNPLVDQAVTTVSRPWRIGTIPAQIPSIPVCLPRW